MWRLTCIQSITISGFARQKSVVLSPANSQWFVLPINPQRRQRGDFQSSNFTGSASLLAHTRVFVPDRLTIHQKVIYVKQTKTRFLVVLDAQTPGRPSLLGVSQLCVYLERDNGRWEPHSSVIVRECSPVAAAGKRVGLQTSSQQESTLH